MINLTYDELRDIIQECDTFCQSATGCRTCPFREPCLNGDCFADLILLKVKEKENALVR